MERFRVWTLHNSEQGRSQNNFSRGSKGGVFIRWINFHCSCFSDWFLKNFKNNINKTNFYTATKLRCEQLPTLLDHVSAHDSEHYTGNPEHTLWRSNNMIWLPFGVQPFFWEFWVTKRFVFLVFFAMSFIPSFRVSHI